MKIYYYMSDSNEKRVMIITGQNNRYKMKEVINGGLKPEKTIRTKMKDVDEDLFLGKQSPTGFRLGEEAQARACGCWSDY
jgi:hypothetical protein